MPQPTTPNPIPIDVTSADWHERINSNFELVKAHLEADALPVKQAASIATLPLPADWPICIALATDSGRPHLALSDGTAWNPLSKDAAEMRYVIVADRKTLNTNGGAINANASNRRDYSWEEADSHAIASFNPNNNVTLPKGVYRCHITAIAHGCLSNYILLYNADTNSKLLGGSRQKSPDPTLVPDASVAILEGVFELTVTTVVRVAQFADSEGGVTTKGAPTNQGTHEMYSKAEYWKIK